MAYDKVVDSSALDSYFSDIADAIRDKNGESGTYTPAEMPQAIEDIETGDPFELIRAMIANSAPYEYVDPEVTRMDFTPFGHEQSDSTNEYLQRVDLPNCIELPGHAFMWCHKLKYARLGARKLQINCFTNCSALETFVSTVDVQEVAKQAFQACSSLTEINMPAAATLDVSAFSYCTSLERIVLGPAARIPASCCANDTALELADIRGQSYSGTAKIFADAFARSGLKALVLRYPSAVTLNATSAFTSTPIAAGTGYIYVPRALISTYEAATNWSTYAGQFRAIEDYTNDGTVNGTFIMPV